MSTRAKYKLALVTGWILAVALTVLIMAAAGCQPVEQKAAAEQRKLEQKAAEVQANDQLAENIVAGVRAKLSAWWGEAKAKLAAVKAGTAPAAELPLDEWDAMMGDLDAQLGTGQQTLAKNTPAINAVAQSGAKLGQLTASSQQQLKDERNHWVGYKGRVFLWSVAGLVTLGMVIYFLATGGIGPIWSIATAWVGLAAAGLTRLLHVGTLGITKSAAVQRAKLQASKPGAGAGGAAGGAGGGNG